MIKTSQSLSRMASIVGLFNRASMPSAALAMGFSEVVKKPLPGMVFQSPKKYPLPDFRAALPPEVQEVFDESQKNMITLDDALNMIGDLIYQRPDIMMY